MNSFFVRNDELTDIPELSEKDAKNDPSKGTFIDGGRDVAVISFIKKDDGSVDNLKNGVLNTFVSQGKNDFSDRGLKGLVVADKEDAPTPLQPGTTLLIPQNPICKDVIDLYKQGIFDEKCISIEYGDANKRFFIPFKLKQYLSETSLRDVAIDGIYVGAIEINPSLHAFHSIIQKNFHLLNSLSDSDIYAALNCFHINYARFCKREYKGKAVKAYRFYGIVSEYLKSQK